MHTKRGRHTCNGFWPSQGSSSLVRQTQRDLLRTPIKYCVFDPSGSTLMYKLLGFSQTIRGEENRDTVHLRVYWDKVCIEALFTFRKDMYNFKELKMTDHRGVQTCTDHSLSVAIWLRRRLGLYHRPCLNLLRGDRVLIPVSPDC